MPQTVQDWITVIAGVWGGLSLFIVWGFASGKFLQKRDDEVDDLRRRVSGLAERVTTNERSISDLKDASSKLREEANASLGRLQHKYELLEERVSVQKSHSDERYERLAAALGKIEEHLSHMQRQLDQRMSEMDGYDPPDRRRR